MPYDPGTYWSDVASRIGARNAEGGWDLAGNDGPFHRYKRSVAVDRLAKLDVRGKTVLELGPGPGGNLKLLHGQGAARLIGCDIAPEMVELARGNLKDLADIRLLDGPAIPLEDREVDVTLTVTVLQHNDDQNVQAIVDELTRVTCSTLELIEDTARRPRSYETYFLRPPGQYIDWVAQRGFRLVDLQPLGVWASEKSWLAMQRLIETTTRKTDEEGHVLSRGEVAAERALLAVTRPLDSRLRSSTGLTAMRFTRI